MHPTSDLTGYWAVDTQSAEELFSGQKVNRCPSATACLTAWLSFVFIYILMCTCIEMCLKKVCKYTISSLSREGKAGLCNLALMTQKIETLFNWYTWFELSLASWVLPESQLEQWIQAVAVVRWLTRLIFAKTTSQYSSLKFVLFIKHKSWLWKPVSLCSNVEWKTPTTTVL